MAVDKVVSEAVAYCENQKCRQRIEPNGEKLCLDCRFESVPTERRLTGRKDSK